MRGEGFAVAVAHELGHVLGLARDDTNVDLKGVRTHSPTRTNLMFKLAAGGRQLNEFQCTRARARARAFGFARSPTDEKRACKPKPREKPA